MSVQTRSVSRGGFWDSGKNTYSPETQKLLKEMMQESKLTSYQQRTLHQTLQNGDALPLRCAPQSGEKNISNFGGKKKSRKALTTRLLDGGKRTKDTIEAMGAYNQPSYRPHPVRRCYDKEKQKLADIMAYGKDNEMQKMRPLPKPEPEESEEEIDRFEELQNEIEVRSAFLKEMESLGQGKKYRSIIQTEISQKIREMEIIDKQRTLELEQLRAEKRKLQAQEKSPISDDPVES